MKKHPLLAALVCAAALSGFSTGASAQFAKAEDAIKYRQSALFVMAQHFGRVGAMANGKVPFDAKAAEQNADIVAQMAKLPWAGFDAAHEGGKAKPEIWKEQAKFKDLADKMQAETVKLAVAAKTGDLDKLKAAFGPAAASCKACHDDFRNR
ncbi:c-type cytochrome [Comamonas odontotermitis]|nr:cytochrome c [Comamonas odontotermitis]UBB18970.1 cytochrome c [Comamonas odontotermitis]